LKYDTLVNHDILQMIPATNIQQLMQTTCLRTSIELKKARELAEIWHWRSRTRQLIQDGESLQPNLQMNGKSIETLDDTVRTTARSCKEKGIVEVINDDFAVLGKAYRILTLLEWATMRSIVQERHFALNWLCGYAPKNRWDDTPTDT